MPARMRVFVTVVYDLSFKIPLTGIFLWRKYRSKSLPASSSPTIPTGRTFTPRSARLLAALAPPPGRTVRSRCFRISTGASRDTREISPNINSSATRSPNTVTVMLGKSSTIFLSRSASLGCFVILSSAGIPPFAETRLMTCAALPNSTFSFGDRAEDSINSVSGIGEFHFHLDHREGLQRGEIRPEVNGVFLGGDEASSRTAELGRQ